MAKGIREIAKMAGVSPTTVSLVLNEKEGVGDETRQRIKQLLVDNGYVAKKYNKNRPAAELPVCIIRHTSRNPAAEESREFVSAIVDNIYAACYHQGVKLSAEICYPETLQQVIANAVEGRYSGLIIIGSEFTEAQIRILDTMDFRGKPVIVLDNMLYSPNVCSVTAAYVEVSHIAVKHLYDLGFRTVGYLQSAVAAPKYEDRQAGMEEILRKLDMRCEWKIPLPPTITGAYEQMKAWLEKGEDVPPALCADTDGMALGAMRALQEKGYRIPEDISIVGAGNVEFGVMSNPPLTTVNLSSSQISTVTMCLMMKKLKEEGASQNVEHIAVRGRLVPRGSTCAPAVEA